MGGLRRRGKRYLGIKDAPRGKALPLPLLAEPLCRGRRGEGGSGLWACELAPPRGDCVGIYKTWRRGRRNLEERTGSAAPVSNNDHEQGTFVTPRQTPFITRCPSPPLPPSLRFLSRFFLLHKFSPDSFSLRDICPDGIRAILFFSPLFFQILHFTVFRFTWILSTVSLYNGIFQWKKVLKESICNEVKQDIF